MATNIQTQAIGAQTYTAQKAGDTILGKDDFLKLLITQLRYQDPLDPMKGTEFASQLAQFSSVEQLANINSNLSQSLQANQMMAQSIGNTLATTMIGRGVKATANEVQFSGSGTLHLGYTLPSDAASVSVKVLDSSGEVVRTIKATGVDAGDTTVSWDGTNDSGQTVPSGTYTFSVDALDSNGAAVTATTFLSGIVTGVRFTASGTVFIVGGEEIPVSQILEIYTGKGNG